MKKGSSVAASVFAGNRAALESGKVECPASQELLNALCSVMPKRRVLWLLLKAQKEGVLHVGLRAPSTSPRSERHARLLLHAAKTAKPAKPTKPGHTHPARDPGKLQV